MKPHIVLFILTGVAVLGLVATVLAGSAGWLTEETTGVAAMSLFAIIVVTAILGAFLYRREQGRSWARLAEGLGLSPEGRGVGGPVRLKDTLTGTYGDHSVMVQTLVVHAPASTRAVRSGTGSGRSRRERFTRIGLHHKDTDPDFWLQAQSRRSMGLIEGLFKSGLHDGTSVKTGDHTIDRRFQVRSNKAETGLRLIASEAKTILDDHLVHEFLVDKGRAMVTLRGFHADVDRVKDRLGRLRDVTDALNRRAEATATVP